MVKKVYLVVTMSGEMTPLQALTNLIKGNYDSVFVTAEKPKFKGD